MYIILFHRTPHLNLVIWFTIHREQCFFLQAIIFCPTLNKNMFLYHLFTILYFYSLWTITLLLFRLLLLFHLNVISFLCRYKLSAPFHMNNNHPLNIACIKDDDDQQCKRKEFILILLRKRSKRERESERLLPKGQHETQNLKFIVHQTDSNKWQ